MKCFKLIKTKIKNKTIMKKLTEKQKQIIYSYISNCKAILEQEERVGHLYLNLEHDRDLMGLAMKGMQDRLFDEEINLPI